jgi:hypothetical protein
MATVRPSTTPNPNAMKFTLDVTLPDRIDTTRGEGTDSEFAQALLGFDGVASVFGINDFVTITREPGSDWDPIVCAVEEAAEQHLEASAGARASDELAEARKLLRNAVAPPKPRPVEIGRPPSREPEPPS